MSVKDAATPILVATCGSVLVSCEHQQELAERRARERERRRSEERRRSDERLQAAKGVATDALARLDAAGVGLAGADPGSPFPGAAIDLSARRRALEARLEAAPEEEVALLVAADAELLREDLRLDEGLARVPSDANELVAELGRLRQDVEVAGHSHDLLGPTGASQAEATFERLGQAALGADRETAFELGLEARREATAYLRRVALLRAARNAERDRAGCALRRFEDRLTAAEVDAVARRWAVDAVADLWERSRALTSPFTVGAFAEVCDEVARLDRQLERVLADAEDHELAFWRGQMVVSALLAAMAEESLTCEVSCPSAPEGPRVIHARSAMGGSVRVTVDEGGSLTYEVFADWPVDRDGDREGDREGDRDGAARERVGALHERLAPKGVRTGPLHWESDYPD